MKPLLSRGHRWTSDADDFLEAHWGIWGIQRLAKRLRRTPTALALRARALGLGPACAKLITLRELERISGYDRSRIMGVVKRLRLQPRRAQLMSERKPTRAGDGHRRMLFTEEQRRRFSPSLRRRHTSKSCGASRSVVRRKSARRLESARTVPHNGGMTRICPAPPWERIVTHHRAAEFGAGVWRQECLTALGRKTYVRSTPTEVYDWLLEEPTTIRPDLIWVAVTAYITASNQGGAT